MRNKERRGERRRKIRRAQSYLHHWFDVVTACFFSELADLPKSFF